MQISALSSALNGLEKSEKNLNSAAQSISTNPGDSVSLSENAVSLLEAKNAAKANVSVLRTVDEMESATLSLAR